MSSEEIRAAARESAARSRVEQGLPPIIEDPVVLDQLVALLTARPDPREPGQL